jgi:ABC-type Fe3+-hydroxamate transport system substrate-binding protein
MSLNTEVPARSPSLAPTTPSSPPARTVSVTLAVIVVVVVAAVGIGATALYYDLHPVKNSPTASPTGSKTTNVTVVDDLGRSVTAPENAARVVVLSPSIMDILYRLGLRSHVVAVGCTPSISGGILNEYSPNQTALWGLSNSTCVTDFPSLDTGAVALADPQLVLASTITSEAAVETLTNTYGLPVVILAPSTLEGVVGDVRIVSQLFPLVQNASTALEVRLSGALSNATTIDANLSSNEAPVPSVLLSYYFDSGGYYCYGPGTFGASLIDLAGGSNICGSAPLEYGEINATAVLNDEPNVILYGTSWNDPDLVAEETPSDWTTAVYWSQLSGAKIAVDITVLTEADPSMVLYLPWLQHDLFPSQVPAP